MFKMQASNATGNRRTSDSYQPCYSDEFVKKMSYKTHIKLDQ